jgi:hypothetical protein
MVDLDLGAWQARTPLPFCLICLAKRKVHSGELTLRLSGHLYATGGLYDGVESLAPEPEGTTPLELLETSKLGCVVSHSEPRAAFRRDTMPVIMHADHRESVGVHSHYHLDARRTSVESILQ